ncbi:MAG: sensor histidine kinase [Rhizobiaceae bacterium]
MTTSTAQTRQSPPLATINSARSLSSKLLMLTILFVMIAEVLIFIPSVANFRMRWLQDKLNTAAVAAVAFSNSDSNTVSRTIQDDMLMATGAEAIVMRDGEASRLLAVKQMPPHVDRHVDLTSATPLNAIQDVLDTLINGGNRSIRLFGPIGDSKTKNVEIVLSDKGLRDALLVYARNVFFLSLLISLITAALVFLSIQRILIRPIRAMTVNMLSFSAAPENPTGIIIPDSRNDELGVAVTELASMQRELQRTLSARKHLADLGLAVSKINHDMRNMLAPAQLLSDRLTDLEDPTVRKVAPRLLKALDRAVTFSESVMAYGKASENPPNFRRLSVKQLIDDVFDLIVTEETRKDGFEITNRIGPELEVEADPDQMFRVISNLVRNSVQALTGPHMDAAEAKRLTVSGGRVGSMVMISIEDNGPGLPPIARENLFSAFRGSARAEGTGLGLAIAHELVTLHGGTIELRDDRQKGTHFEIRLPDRPVSLVDWQKRNPKTA